MVTELFIILGLVLINGLFAMSEIALVSVRKNRLESAAKRGDLNAKKALKLQNDPTKLLSTVQIGITLVSLLTGIYSGANIKQTVTSWFMNVPFLVPYAETTALIAVLIVITSLSLIVGELVPKRIGLSYPEPIAKFMAGPMLFLAKITAPFIWFLSRSSDLLIAIIRVKRSNDDKVTEEEIKAIIQEGTETGAIDEIEQDIMERVFHLGDRKIGSLMTHRNDIVWLDVNEPIEKIKADMQSEIHSIYPACDEDLDRTLGIVYIKEMFLASTTNNLHSIKDYVRPILFLPENNTAYSVLEKFKETKIHYALVVDEYGAIQGLITINDILEAIVGEFDELNLPDYSIIEREDGSFLVDGGLPFYDFLKYFEIEEFDNLDVMQYNTLAGFIIDQLGYIPKTGQKLEWKTFEFEVVDMDASRIDKLLFKSIKHS